MTVPDKIFRLTPRERLRGAWVGMFAADRIARDATGGDEPSAPSLSLIEAIHTVQSLGSMKCFEGERLSDCLTGMEAEYPDADFSHVEDDDGALLRCLAVSLWFRSKPIWRVLEALEACLDITPVSTRGRIATLAICMWARELHDSRRDEDPWQRYADAWARALIDAGYPEDDVMSLMGPDDAAVSAVVGDDLASCMVRLARACPQAASLADCVEVVGQATRSPGMTAAAGLVFGLARGDEAIAAEWPQLAHNTGGFEETLDILLRKQRASPELRRNVDVTSENCPLFLSPINCLAGKLFLTTAPGASKNVGYSDRGLVNIRRDMDADVARITASGATHLVTTLTGDELVDAEITSLRICAEAAGLTWLHLPFADRDLSQRHFQEDLNSLLPALRSVLARGGAIALHADDWRGRTEVLIPALLARLDESLSKETVNERALAAMALGWQNDPSMELA
jgi:hypothetical protein